MVIDPQAFVMKMADRWRNSIGGVVTLPLKQVWQQQAKVFNSKIKGNYCGRWLVLQPPTGSGKSRGLETYCSMLPRDNHPGVMIVVRMIEDAENMVDTINQLTEDSDVAITSHSENGVLSDEVSDFPVLVITHAAYKIAIESPLYWHNFMKWRGEERKLVVIDECLNIIEQTQVNFDQLRELRGVIPEWLQDEYSLECAELDTVIGLMDKIKNEYQSTGKVISSDDWGLRNNLSLAELSQAISTVNFDEIILKKTDESERKNLQVKYRSIIDAVEKLVQQPSTYQKKGLFHLFTCGRVTMPKDRMDAVVMDATASCNPIYKLLGSRVKLIDPPKNVRNYSNVNLHVSFGHKIGKIAMSKTPQHDAHTFIAGIVDELPRDRKLFICTHKAVEPHLMGYDEQFPAYSVSHWGAVDGKNDWNDYGTAIMYGLQSLDGIVGETMLQALEEWHDQEFPIDVRDSLKHEIELGHQVVTLVQAMNRVRCRHVTDKNGGCDLTDIYLLMPDKSRSKEILQPLFDQMPGMVLKPWAANAPKRKVKRSKYETVLVKFLAGLSRGSHPVTAVRETLCIPPTCFDRLITKALDGTSDLYNDLLEIGTSFHRHGEGLGGRGNISWFEKVA